MKIITDQAYAPAFCTWMSERFEGEWYADPKDVRTIALVDEDEILTVAMLSKWTPHTVEATLASSGAKRQKASREYIWTIFDYVFNHAGKSRLITYVGVDNVKSLAVQELLGMKLVARIADHFGEDKDAFLFGLTKREWLAGRWATLSPDLPEINKETNGGPDGRHDEPVQRAGHDGKL